MPNRPYTQGCPWRSNSNLLFADPPSVPPPGIEGLNSPGMLAPAQKCASRIGAFPTDSGPFLLSEGWLILGYVVGCPSRGASAQRIGNSYTQTVEFGLNLGMDD